MRAAALIAAAGCLLPMCGGCGEDAPMGGPLVSSNEIGEGGLFPGQFSYPRAIDVLGGDLVVIDKSGRVQLIEPEDGSCLAIWEMPRMATGKPTGVTVAPGPDGSDAVYIADTHEQRVLIYAAPGPDGGERGGAPEVVAEFGSLGRDGGQFLYLTDIAVLADEDGKPERIYTSEYGGNDRVSIFDGDYGFLGSFGSWGRTEEDSDEVLFDRPQSIAIVPGRDELVVADAGNHRLGRFTLEGELIGWVRAGEMEGLAEDEQGPGPMSYPYGLAVLSDGTVLVAEYGSGRLRHVDLERDRTIGIYGRAGRGPGEIASPWGVAVIGKTAYALDSGNNRILAFESPVSAGAYPSTGSVESDGGSAGR